MSDPLERLKKDLRVFARKRGWGRYHTPKNLAMAMAQSRKLTLKQKVHVGEEIADVLIYLTKIADACGVDMMAAARDKMRKNALKYPEGRKPLG